MKRLIQIPCQRLFYKVRFPTRNIFIFQVILTHKHIPCLRREKERNN